LGLKVTEVTLKKMLWTRYKNARKRNL